MTDTSRNDMSEHEGSTDSGRWSVFINDTQSVALQLDLLFAVVIITGAFTIFLIFGMGLISDIQGEDYGDEINAMRSANILAGDYLVANPNNNTLSRDCTESYFDQSPDPDCGHNTSWSSDSFLNDSLPLATGNANITIRTISGDIAVLNGDKLAAGSSPPVTYDEAKRWNRYVALDVNGDGDASIYRLVVYTW